MTHSLALTTLCCVQSALAVLVSERNDLSERISRAAMQLARGATVLRRAFQEVGALQAELATLRQLFRAQIADAASQKGQIHGLRLQVGSLRPLVDAMHSIRVTGVGGVAGDVREAETTQCVLNTETENVALLEDDPFEAFAESGQMNGVGAIGSVRNGGNEAADTTENTVHINGGETETFQQFEDDGEFETLAPDGAAIVRGDNDTFHAFTEVKSTDPHSKREDKHQHDPFQSFAGDIDAKQEKQCEVEVDPFEAFGESDWASF